LNSLLLFLHVLSVSTWLGAALWVAGDVRRTLALGKLHAGALPARVRPALSLDQWAAVAAFLTGIGLIGWQEVSAGLHPRPILIVGLVLALARAGLTGAAVRPAWRALEGRIVAGEAVPADDPGVRRLAMLTGIGHVLWAAALVTMVW
jgi:hypothetical protein